MSRGNGRGLAVGAIALAVVLVAGVVYGLFALIVGLNSYTTADGGHVVVVREGGEFDSNNFRQIVTPADGRTYTGWFSHEHPYPISQRNFVVSSAPGADSNESISVSSSDGIAMTITGTFFFKLNTDPKILEKFDNNFGTRQYNNGTGKYAWEGDEGWTQFLNFTFKNFVENDLRAEVGKVKCADLYPSCALINQTGSSTTTTVVVAPKDTSANITAIQNAVNTSFAADIKTHLGEEYFTDINFVLASAVPPAATVDAIAKAQQAFASNATAQAAQQQAVIAANTKLQEAQIAAKANEVTQQGYTACPVCADIDKIAALPKGITTYVAPGGAAAPVVAVGK